MKYKVELDGLRAIAIAAVAFNHFFSNRLPGGYIGVDLFFVLSGYLITSILVDEFDRTKKINLWNFYARRFMRLMPALAALLTLYAILAAGRLMWHHSPDFASTHFWALAAAASYMMNWNVAFDFGSSGFLTHTWSLSVEEQFYILWPLILVLLLPHLGRKQLAGLCVVMIGVGNLWRSYLWYNGASAIRLYAGFDTRFDCILIGCLLVLMPIHNDWRNHMARYLPVPLAVMAGFLLWVTWDSEFYELGTVLPALCSAWIIMAVLADHDSRFVVMLRLKPINYLGRISYGFYLWHFPIWLALGWCMAGSVNVRALATLGLSLLTASTSYHFLEMPLRKYTNTFGSPASDPFGASQRHRAPAEA